MTEPTNLRTCPKKARKPQPHTLLLWNAIIDVVNEYDRMSIRQLYYQLVARGVVEKTEQAYKRVCDAATQMRFDGALPYVKIVDGNRERQIRAAYADMKDALGVMHQFYRKDYWASQRYHVEVWCEKDALSGLINPICREYGVPYVAARGFASVSVRWQTAEEINASGKSAIIFYFGDHDASGQSASNVLESEIGGRHGADVNIHRVALGPEHIRQYNLPTRPGKKTDSRHLKFVEQYGDEATELDALPPNVLTTMVRESIESRIDWSEWNRIKEIEDLERRSLESISLLDLEPGSLIRLTDDAA